MKLDKLYLERELIPVSFDSRDMDVFADRKLAEMHYKNLGYIVIPGFDFENNMIFSLKNEFDYLDPYLKVKLGRAKGSPLVTAYANHLLQYLTKKEVMLLLYLCRLCSYLGGPGFPEFIIVDQKIRRWSLVVVAEEVPAEYALFAFMIRLLGLCEIKMANIRRSGVQEKAVIDIKGVMESIAATERFKAFIEGTESCAKLTDSGQEDELKFLEEQVYKTPFFLIKNWLKDGAEKEDILQAYKNFEVSNSEMRALIESITKEMQNSMEYKSIGNGRDEETLKKKFFWLIKTFSLGESRAKEMLNLFV